MSMFQGVLGGLRAGRFATREANRAYKSFEDSGFTSSSRAGWTQNGQDAKQDLSEAEASDKQWDSGLEGGLRGMMPWQHKAEEQAAIAGAQQSNLDDQNMQSGVDAKQAAAKNLAKYKEEFQREQDQMQNAETPDAVGRERNNAQDAYRDQMVQAKKMEVGPEGSDFKAEGYKSVADQQAARAALVDTAKRELDAKQKQADHAEQSAVDAVDSQAEASKLQQQGDTAGAERVKFQQELRNKSDEEHKKSQAAGDEFDKVTRPQLEDAFDQKQGKDKAADAEKAEDEVTKITQQAQAERLAAEGQSYAAEKAAHDAALDDKVKKAQQAADNETDTVKKANLQKVADATANAAVSEKTSYDMQHQREDHQGAEKTDAKTNAEAMRFSGRGDDAKLYEDAVRAKEEIDKDNKAGNTEEAEAVKKRFEEQSKEAAYKKDQAQHSRDLTEEESKMRADGNGAEAEYVSMREKDAENIRNAAKTGDKDQIKQAQRTAQNDIKAYLKDTQQKGQAYNSAGDYANSLMFSASNDNGLGKARKMANSDLHDLQSGTGLKGDKSGEKLDGAAMSLGRSAEKWDKLLSKSIQLVIAGT